MSLPPYWWKCVASAEKPKLLPAATWLDSFPQSVAIRQRVFPKTKDLHFSTRLVQQ